MNTPETTLSFDDALNHCLQALLQERRTLEESLALYPQYADDLKPLLQTALLTHRLKKPVLSDDRVAALEDRLMKAFAETPAIKNETAAPSRRPSPLMIPAWMTRSAAIVALVLLAVLGTGGGTVAASANSVPGEPLYGVKRAWEDFIVMIVDLFGDASDVLIHLARVRWEEIETLHNRQQPIPDETWYALTGAVKTAYQGSVIKQEQRLVVLWDTVQKTVTQWPDRKDIYVINLGNILIPGTATPASVVDVVLTPTPELIAASPTDAPTETPTATQVMSVASTATPTPLVFSTPTRTPTPSRTPTLSPTPSQTTTPQAPLPTVTATYTRLPLNRPTQVIILPTQPQQSNDPDVIDPVGPGLPSDPEVDVGGNTPLTPSNGTIDPVIRPTMQSVYATQTAIASGAEKSATPQGQ